MQSACIHFLHYVSTKVTDLVAFSGVGFKKYEKLLSAAINQDSITTLLVDNLLSVGWTIIEGPTAQAFGTGYKLRSQQSPWYDDNNVPSWYVGNKLVLQIDNGQNSNFLVLGLGVDHNGTTEFLTDTTISSEQFRLRYADVGDFNFHCNRYQFAYWGSNIGSVSSAPDRMLVASVVNVPKALQQRFGVIHMAVGSSRFRRDTGSFGGDGGGKDWSVYRTKFDAGTSHITQKGDRDLLRFMTVRSGREEFITSGRRIWNRGLDLDMSDPTKWSAFMLPATAIWTLPGETTATINGFFWDALILSEGFTDGTVIDPFAERRWVYFDGTRNPTNDNQATTMFLNSGLSVL